MSKSRTEHVEPFVLETVRTFEAMLGVCPKVTDMSEKESTSPTYDVSAIIGISGAGTGGLVLSFPQDVACKVVSKMLGQELSAVDQDVADGIGELVNIITGNAKRSLVKHGYRDLSVSLPNVVVGKHRTVWCSKDMPCRVTQFFMTEFGQFCIEVNIRPAG